MTVDELFAKLAGPDLLLDHGKLPENKASLVQVCYGHFVHPQTFLSALEAARRNGSPLDSTAFVALMEQEAGIAAKEVGVGESDLI